MTAYIFERWDATKVFARRSYEVTFSSRFIRNVSQTFLTRMALFGMGFVSSVLITRALGPIGRGTYAAALTLSSICIQMGNLGLHASNIYEVSRDRSRLSKLLGNSLLVGFGLGTAIVTGAWAFFCFCPPWAPVQGYSMTLALLAVPFGLTYVLLQHLLLGVEEVRAYNLIELAMAMLALALSGTAVWIGWIAVEVFQAVNLAVLILSFLCSYGRLRRIIEEALEFSWKLFRNNLRYGLNAYLAAIFSFLALRFDILMVKNLLGTEQTGYYSLAVSLADYVMYFPIVIGTLLFPKLSAMPGRAEKWFYAKKAALAVAGIMLVLSASAALLAASAIRLTFGAAFLPAVPAFWCLLPGVLMISVNTILMNYFAASGMPAVTVYSPAIAALLNVIVNLRVIPHYGIVGAAATSTLCYGTMLLLSLLYIRCFEPKEGSA